MNIVKEALAAQASHILFVDTDQTFPRDTLHRLLIRDKDVIACNIATKQIPANPTAKGPSPDGRGSPVYTDPGSPAVQKVWRVGTGIMLVKVRVFEKIGLGCFGITYKPELQDYQGEDWSMCEAMEAAGYDIWVDHRLSDEVKHIGDFEYDHNVVGERTLVEDKVIGER